MRLIFAFQHCRYITVGWAVVTFFQHCIMAYWKNIILYHEIHCSFKIIMLFSFQERYTFAANSIQMNNIEISDLSLTGRLFWNLMFQIHEFEIFTYKLDKMCNINISFEKLLSPYTVYVIGFCFRVNHGLLAVFNVHSSSDFIWPENASSNLSRNSNIFEFATDRKYQRFE